MEKHTLKKTDRLKNKKAIDPLFRKGNYFKAYPLFAYYELINPGDAGQAMVRAGFSTSKRKVKKAVTRNLVKRRIKEIYRVENKRLKKLVETTGMSLHVMFVYQTSEVLSSAAMKPKIILLLQRLEALLDNKKGKVDETNDQKN